MTGTTTRERALARAFVDLADSLVQDFDVADLLHDLVNHVSHSVGADAAGLLLSDHRGELHLLASTTEASKSLELFQMQSDQGPCLDCFRTGEPVNVPDIWAALDTWPEFVPAAYDVGYRAVHALPMRLRDEVIGTLNLFGVDAGPLPAPDLEVAQALADVATIAILQERAAHHREIVIEQTQAALHNRTIIEQAKGLLAASGIGMDEAFRALRAYAHGSHLRLSSVAWALVAGQLDSTQVLGASPDDAAAGGTSSTAAAPTAPDPGGS